MTDAPQPTAPAAVSFPEALRWWFKLGCISFGGPAGQIAIMHRELVETRRWISENRFLHALNYCMLLPGPEAQQLATYIGWLMHGVRGGIAAGALFVLPSLILLIALSVAYVNLGAPLAADLLYGIRPAVVAIIAFAAWRIGSKVLRQKWLWPVPVAAFVALYTHVPFPAVIVAAALYGWLLRERLGSAAAQHAATAAHRPALIDDDTPTPPHVAYSSSRLVVILLFGVLLAGTVYASLAALYGFDSLFNAMGLFFGKAALVTFGGAYAVMPYVFQGAVVGHGWLSATQMMDGLALGETTPGPLIMVVAFVGFMGGWNGMPAEPLAAGLMGACVASFFTFLPSFIFIFAGAPWVERTRGSFRLAGPMSAITAAVVGAILSLALFFAAHVFWPQPGVDVVAMAIAVVGWVALWRNWLGMIPLIVLSAAVGAAYRLLG
ncbi:chromate transporter [Panacagrimonas perspica]|uniref:Chromate transporter n=1 Tax=Panacagrimonas perspica TaxID=381431 RepID=A0A4S3K3V1_9GAMM|nr:chromate efflux transporter [Panacagrimonas perspica]TDU31282.1 chromate transporter [Panacagrimonas perspica]THD02628.1 chromate transporter [Panacagrimonas perspica]